MNRTPDTSPASVPLRWRATLATLDRLPQGALSRAFGWLADRRIAGPLRPLVLGGFASAVGIRMEEAELPLTAYASVNALFVRRLRPGVRTWPSDPRLLVSPVDGVLGAFGTVEDGTLLQAKGLPYRAADLLGSDEEARPFMGGRFITLYLSPRHYHRIHTPVPGAVRSARHVPGALLPVNGPAVAGVERLFARNERLLAHLDTALGRVAVVAVGAYNVGRISTAFDPAWSGTGKDWVTNRRDPPPPERHYDPGIPLGPGQELMAFHLGSTIVLLTEPGIALEADLAPGSEVTVGTVLAGPGS
ncbi:MAG TPA: archaetidylserine decarboxylase [Longimicrobiales bacterium]|nr:archaetidylserine decarboxylase [Longimicrobiales bacterium]